MQLYYCMADNEDQYISMCPGCEYNRVRRPEMLYQRIRIMLLGGEEVWQIVPGPIYLVCGCGHREPA